MAIDGNPTAPEGAVLIQSDGYGTQAVRHWGVSLEESTDGPASATRIKFFASLPAVQPYRGIVLPEANRPGRGLPHRPPRHRPRSGRSTPAAARRRRSPRRRGGRGPARGAA